MVHYIYATRAETFCLNCRTLRMCRPFILFTCVLLLSARADEVRRNEEMTYAQVKREEGTKQIKDLQDKLNIPSAQVNHGQTKSLIRSVQSNDAQASEVEKTAQEGAQTTAGENAAQALDEKKPAQEGGGEAPAGENSSQASEEKKLAEEGGGQTPAGENGTQASEGENPAPEGGGQITAEENATQEHSVLKGDIDATNMDEGSDESIDGTAFWMSDDELRGQKAFIRREEQWRPYAFRSFDHMDNPTLRDYKYGFPPGIYGSSLIPLTIWYHLWGMKKDDEMFLQPKNLILLNIDYVKMISSCSERTNPRCSWHYFLSLLHPLGFHKKLLQFLVPSFDNLHKSEYYPVPVVQGACYPFTSIDQISLIYIYHICHFYQGEDDKNLELLHLCPNPCLKRPCKLIERAVDGSCVSYGFHKNDYRCTCEEGFEWEDSTLLCSIVDNCNKICNQTTTSSCIVNRTAATAICQCKDGYMGFDCSQPYDACVLGSAPDARGLNVGPIIPSGYDACGTTLDARNLCFNVAKANTYKCVCSPAYVRDISVPYDNCLKPLDSCDKRICVHGQCVTAPDLLKSVCDCDDGYTGSKCDQPTGTWSTWTEWSACEPICGPASHRRRLRMCLSEHEEDCIGPVEEVRRCASGIGCVQDIPVEEETWLDFMEWTNYAMMITLGYIGVLAIFLSILGLCRKYKTKPSDAESRSKTSMGQVSYTFRSSRQSADQKLRKSTDALPYR
ncbi:hypothetical protein FGIG_05974 [Fasciola gigantica]|uniref:EGF-like domain-containing protein n=1 Tax=Fasciola gigantica TaxID=46835 RepID=A0A504YK27_FASGI|nr:hypothetical protein FGIG_05974 [Fasciola gigantica]